MELLAPHTALSVVDAFFDDLEQLWHPLYFSCSESYEHVTEARFVSEVSNLRMHADSRARALFSAINGAALALQRHARRRRRPP